jgi:phosphodiesterase/alkaline phosphatase D-like protein
VAASLVVGPLLRYAGESDATVWVETDAACTVEVLGCRDATFCVHGHHYALVHVTGLEPGATTPYEVRLDSERVWPQADSTFGPSVIRTPRAGEPTVLAFGSCRVSAPHEPPYSLGKDEDPRGRETDALRALAMRMASSDADEPWPHLLLMLGDQVYADELSPRTRELIAARRDLKVPPGEQVADFEEYTFLYRESWCEPHIRWLLSTVPSAMIFDDHDVIDDWNTSLTWVRRMRATGWWDDRIVGGLMSYWIYQHIGNLAPERLADNEQWRHVRENPADATRVLREFAFAADREVQGTRWSYSRQVAGTRVVVVDSRAGRVLEPEHRSMLDEDEWAWLEERAGDAGGADHLLIATSLPVLLPHGMHYFEAFNEAVCDGAWGHRAARLGERVREGLDLEHWAAFGASLERLMGIVEGAARGEDAPASIAVLSGDVHHAYLAEVEFPDDGVRSRVWQAVCSPFRNPLDAHERHAIRAALSWPARAFAHALARSAGVRRPPLRWRFADSGPWFDNQVATITLEGRRARLVLEKTVPDGDDLVLERVFSHELA